MENTAVETQFKNKVISLSIGDIISVGMFLISIGITFGYYQATLKRLDSLEKNVDQITSNIVIIRENCSSYKTSLDNIKEDMRDLKKIQNESK